MYVIGVKIDMEPMHRSMLIKIVKTALSLGETRFVRECTLAWLAVFPGDLRVRLLHAHALLKEGRPQQAQPVLAQLCAADPLFLEAWKLLGQAQTAAGQEVAEEVRGALLCLGPQPDSQAITPEWGLLLWLARQEIRRGALAEAEQLAVRAMEAAPDSPLPARVHLSVLLKRHDPSAAREQTPKILALRKIIEHYQRRWPECLAFSLGLADTLMAGGEAERAVALLHACAARDVAGQVPAQLWGAAYAYRDLWPTQLRLALEVPFPAKVAAAFGWNQLPRQADVPASVKMLEAAHLPAPGNSGRPPPPREAAGGKHAAAQAKPAARATLSPPSATPLPKEVKKALDTAAARVKQPEAARADGRFPIYVLFSTRGGLEKVYGAEGAAAVRQRMQALAKAVDGQRKWGVRVFLGDDAQSTGNAGVKPAPAEDAWRLKLTLADLDEALRKRGEMIGAVLIVGGPEVVPFHRLPNPIDDMDTEVLSDNPYATRDENYFVPEWPVGRLPGGAGRSPAFLLRLLKRLEREHARRAKKQAWWRIWWAHLAGTWARQRWPHPWMGGGGSFGYTAEIWQRASGSVFRPIGKPETLLVSPPVEAGRNGKIAAPGNGKGKRIPTGTLGYFNLHGVADSPAWYGQRDPALTKAGPDYPVALRPADVLNGGRAPRVVFSEACYGAHITGKAVDEALALKFLDAGTQVVAGSTVTAYGSVRAPLVAADLLGQAFWQHLQTGRPAGEALRRAKVALAKEMHRRQGFLDGEDQKTLISFVLYGDPLAQPGALGSPMESKSIVRSAQRPTGVRAVCNRSHGANASPRRVSAKTLPQDSLDEVRRVVQKYLPGMADAEIWLSQQHTEKCAKGCQFCPFSGRGGAKALRQQAGRQVVALSKQVRAARQVHPHFAHLTLAGGKVVKVAVSR